MVTTGDITLGVKVFKRTDALTKLLESAERANVGKVIVADDGHTEERQHIYDRRWAFDFQLLDLEYDAGVGTGRAAIVEAYDTPYLMMTDPDMQVPADLYRCLDILEADDSLGGVAPIMFEGGRPKAYAHDLKEVKTPLGTVLVRGMWERPAQEFVADNLIVRLDVVPNLALYRREALETHSWDPFYENAKDHLDNMVGHWRAGEWDFAVAPEVVVQHTTLDEDPDDYQISRENRRRKAEARRYFLRKWGYRQILHNGIWFDTERHPLQPPNRYLRWAPASARVLAMDLYDGLDVRGVFG